MDRNRLSAIAVFLTVLFSCLIIRFFQIQILEGEKWTSTALSQHQAVIPEPFKRGCFYSNTSIKEGHPEDEQPFVFDILKYHLFVDPKSVSNFVKNQLAHELALLLPVSEDKIFDELQRKSRSRKIAHHLDLELKTLIEKWWQKFYTLHKLPKNALYFQADYKRSYPFGSMLGTVLHTVQEEKDPQTGQSIPTGGLELAYNQYLIGKPGKKLMVRSPRRPLDTGKILQTPENGADVFLTVNHYLQAIAESCLEKGVKEAGALGGWAVMMDPYTGEILALAQTPCFDPTNYSQFFNNPELVDATRSLTVTQAFEPGSILKPLTMAICLQANEELKKQGRPPLFSKEEKIATSNGWFPGRSTPLKDGRLHQFLNMDLAIQKSSNIYVAKIVQRLIDTLGPSWYRQQLSDVFGFGQKTNIELPGETPGLLPTPGKLHPNGKLQWSTPTPYSLAMGYNLLVNSIQMVKAYAVLANGGFDVQPHIVRKIVKKQSDGTISKLLDQSCITSKKRVLSESVVKAVTHSLKFTTKEGGTAKRADIAGYTEAGKSGTSEKVIDGVYSKENHISSFVGFAPASNPRFVLLVSIDDPEKKIIAGVGQQQLGGVCAGPVFRDIAIKALQYLGVSPDDPYGYPSPDPRRDPKKADFAQEVNDLRRLYEQWNGR